MTETQRPADYYRYCPGEESVHISDAICFGRRRVSYPKCKGCQFNDDEQRAGKATAADLERESQRSVSMEKIFKAYDVRGTYPDQLDEDIAWRVGYAAAQFMRSSLSGFDRGQEGPQAVVVGRDMRKSSPALASALIEGVRAANIPVTDVGMIDTSQLVFAVNHLRAAGGVVVTASHNPPKYNGFKLCGYKGRPIGADTGLKEVQRMAASTHRFSAAVQASATQRELVEEYRQFIRTFLRLGRKAKAVIDASNGMAGRWFPLLFEDVEGLQVVPLNFKHDGTFVHPPNPLVEANLEQAKKVILAEKADFGAVFDGDADRCMFIDERAQTVPCDMITAWLAPAFLAKEPGSAIVYDLRSSRVVPEEIERAGGRATRERVGHAFMKKTMSANNAIFGGELSGHFYFRDNWYADSGMLAFVHVVNRLTASDQPFSKAVKPLRRYAASGEINFENTDKDGTIRQVGERYADAEVDCLDGVTVQYADWWFNVRKSNTEPLLRLNLEAANQRMLKQKLAEVSPLLGTRVAH
jgi:phosphomannomutase